MIQYRRILELHFKETTQRTISSSTGHSKQTVSDVIKKAKQLDLFYLKRVINSNLYHCLFMSDYLSHISMHFTMLHTKNKLDETTRSI